MKTASDIKNQVRTTLNELKALLEEVELQVNLGKKEAKEVFDRERDNVSHFIRDQRKWWRRVGMLSEENMNRIKDRLHQLYTLLLDEVPTAPHAFQAWKDERLRMVYELEYIIREFQPGLNDDEKQKINDLKMKLDVYRIHLALADIEKAAALQPVAEALRKQIDLTIHFLENEMDKTWERLDHFKDEIGTSFTHLKKAFGELVGK